MNQHGLVGLMGPAAAAAVLAGALILAAPSDGRAAFVLTLDDDGVCNADGTNCDVHVVDDGDGIVSFDGTVGIFTVTMTTGRSKPAIGSVGEPTLHLISVDLSTSFFSGGQIKISLTDTGFQRASAASDWITSIVGATSGSLGIDAYVGLDNKEFSTTSQVAGVNLSGFFNKTVSQALDVVPGSPFSVTLVATVTHGRFLQGTAFSAKVRDPNPSSIPEPGTLGLFGIGLLGLGFLWRRTSLATAKI